MKSRLFSFNISACKMLVSPGGISIKSEENRSFGAE